MRGRGEGGEDRPDAFIFSRETGSTVVKDFGDTAGNVSLVVGGGNGVIEGANVGIVGVVNGVGIGAIIGVNGAIPPACDSVKGTILAEVVEVVSGVDIGSVVAANASGELMDEADVFVGVDTGVKAPACEDGE